MGAKWRLGADHRLTPNSPSGNVFLCADYGSNVLYCTRSFAFKTQSGNQPPQQSINITIGPTSLSSIAISWMSTAGYTHYEVTVDQEVSREVDGTSYTFVDPPDDLIGSTTHTVSVEGCYANVVFGGGPSGCSGVYTSKQVTIALPPVGNLLAQAVSSSEIQIHFTIPQVPAELHEQVTLSQAPGSISGAATAYGYDAKGLTGGTTYTYTVCAAYLIGKACLTTSATTPSPPPACQPLTKSCPFYQNQPPRYNFTCPSPVDFYSWSGVPVSPTEPPSNSMYPLATKQTTSTGTTTDEEVFVAACNPGTKVQCTSYSIDVSQANWCHPHVQPPPPPPAKNCKACLQNGQRCQPVSGGYQCVGNIQ